MATGKKNTKKRPSAVRGSTRRRSAGKTGGRPRKTVRSGPSGQQRLDVVGIALICVGVFFAFVLYLGARGGGLGEAGKDGLLLLTGRIAYAAPVAFLIAGVICISRPVARLSPARRWGVLLIFGGAHLAFAAGTFGLGRGRPTPGKFDSAAYEHAGGLVGEGMFRATSALLQSTGSHLTAIFLLVAGASLFSATPVATHLKTAASTLGRLTGRSRGFADAETEAGRRVDPDAVPSPPGEADLGREFGQLVHSTHVEASPPPPGATGLPDGDDTEEATMVTEGPPEQEVAELARWGALDTLPSGAAAQVPEAQPGAEGGVQAPAITAGDGLSYRLPDPKLLIRSAAESTRPDTGVERAIAGKLIEALGHFGVEAKLVGTVSGPHITRYELKLAPGTKVAKVAQLKDDLAYALATTDIRILAPIPGKQAVGVEVPNIDRRIVRLGDIYQLPPKDWSPLTVWLGKDIGGKAIGTDLAKMPHILVAGTTGSGKSGAINAMLCSILLRATPNECRLVLIDPKQVELNHYEGIPHLLTPVVTSPRMAANVMNNLLREMEQRYTLMGAMRARSLIELNARRVRDGDEPLPYVLCVIDELADLMMVAPAEVENAIIRLAQKSRAVGMHLVLATQRPSADIITGMIKANVPSRIAFAVSSQTDSRVVLDQNGAESLLGQGDMLFSPIGSSRMQRIQGAYITEDEIGEIVSWWRRQGEPEFQEELLEAVEPVVEQGEDGELDPDSDAMLVDAIALVVQLGAASTSMLQRRLRVGYTRAGRLIDMMERRGVIGGYEGSKARQVLVTEADLPAVLESAGQRKEGVAVAPDRVGDVT